MSKANVISPNKWSKMSTEERHEVEKTTLFAHLGKAGVEAAKKLRQAFTEGNIDGTTYWDGPTVYGEGCGCLLGTLVVASGYNPVPKLDDDEDAVNDIVERYAKQTIRSHDKTAFTAPFDDDIDATDATYLDVVENLVYNVGQGDTPETNETARLLVSWIDEWIEGQS